MQKLIIFPLPTVTPAMRRRVAAWTAVQNQRYHERDDK